ncbi:MAG: DUF3703 domain-containing protein [Sphingomonadaceae bacterium]|nr:DUF3703 domain-containing protein [Sphingomonadaceae bacterium]
MASASLSTALSAEFAAYRRARRNRDKQSVWAAHERMHILSQPLLLQHVRVHVMMLGWALRTGDGREAVGQLARLFLAPLGALTVRIPWGNTGRSSVSAFKSMPLPHNLRHLFAEPPGP